MSGFEIFIMACLLVMCAILFFLIGLIKAYFTLVEFDEDDDTIIIQKKFKKKKSEGLEFEYLDEFKKGNDNV